MKIFGAGISGLLAGCLLPQAEIFEAAPKGNINHKALLRFRTRSVGDAVGIEFRAVTVRKAIWLDGRFVAPTIQLANWYSRKVTEQIGRAHV